MTKNGFSQNKNNNKKINEIKMQMKFDPTNKCEFDFHLSQPHQALGHTTHNDPITITYPTNDLFTPCSTSS